VLRDFPLVSAPRRADGPVPVRDAATVMLLRRPGGGGPGVEVFTLRRAPRMAFAAGMLVFPGGAVEPGDADPRLPWHGPDPADVAVALGTDVVTARSLVAAAVRETFEECGVLLAAPAGPGDGDLADGDSADGDPADGGPHGGVDGDRWEARRRALLAGTATLADVLVDAGWVLRADLLRPWAHWITPAGESRRFDTRFFVAASPPAQRARHLPGEAAEASWRDPAEAVREHGAGRLPLLPPTLVALEELAAARSVPAVLAAPRRLRPVSPWSVHLDGGDVLRVDLDGVGGGEPGPAPSPSPDR